MTNTSALVVGRGLAVDALVQGLVREGWSIEYATGNNEFEIARNARRALSKAGYSLLIIQAGWGCGSSTLPDRYGMHFWRLTQHEYPLESAILICASELSAPGPAYLRGDEFTHFVDLTGLSLMARPSVGTSHAVKHLETYTRDRNRIHENRGLQIDYVRRSAKAMKVLAPEEVLEGLSIEGGASGQPTRFRLAGKDPTPEETVATYARAVDDLVRRLFFDLDSVTLRIPSGKRGSPVGRSGTKVLYCVGDRSEHRVDNVVLKFGEPWKIWREYINYRDHVVEKIGGNRHTMVSESPQRWCSDGNAHLRLRRSGPLAGIAFRLIGRQGDVQTLSEWVTSSVQETSLPEVLRKVVELCEQGWYERRLGASSSSFKGYRDLVDYYNQTMGLDPVRLTRVFSERFGASLKGFSAEQYVDLAVLDGTRLKNPIQAYEQRWSSQSTEEQYGTYAGFRGDLLRIREPYYCYVHGDMNLGNVLVDSSQNVWLLDFFRTGPGHLFEDFAELEVSIIVQLFEEIEIKDLYQLLRRLLSEANVLSPGSQSYPSPSAARLGRAIVALRSEAVRVAGGDRTDEFLLSLFYHSLTMLKFYDLGDEKLMRAMVLAGLVCERLEDGPFV